MSRFPGPSRPTPHPCQLPSDAGRDPRQSYRILMATFGSLGDLFPYLAVAHELARRGHRVTLAAGSMYEEALRKEGFGFVPMSPHLTDQDPKLLARLMDRRRGTQRLLREVLLPSVRAQYADLLPAAGQADLVLSHPITFAAPMAAEKHRLPWALMVLQPMLFFSAHDPPTPPIFPWIASIFRRLPPGLNARLFRTWQRPLDHWTADVHRLRAELGLSRIRNPLFGGMFSPYLNLALFSSAFAAPQPDWPEHTMVTGFPFQDRFRDQGGLPPELERFLSDGPPPLVFTLGSTAVATPGRFYPESIAAARRLGQRAVLLVGRDGLRALGSSPPSPLPEEVLAVPYAPHSQLFPRAAAIVHHGGVGTTGQGLRSGRPTLVVPFAHDQLDNADRLHRLGVGRTLPRDRYTAARAAAELRPLLEEPRYVQQARNIAAQIHKEQGALTAARAIELLAASHPSNMSGERNRNSN